MAAEIVELIIKARDMFSSVGQKVGKSVSKLNENITGFNNVMSQNMEQFKRNIVPMKGMTNRGAILANRFRMMTHGLRGFRMEMLGVMFFGMGVARMFSTMLKPAAETFGIFELWSSLLEITFIPMMTQLITPLLALCEWVVNIPEPMQIALGYFSLIGLVFGKILMTVGMLALGLGSLFQTSLPKALAKAWGAVSKFFGGLTTSALGVFVIISAIIIGAIFAWKENFANMKDWVDVLWQGIKNIISGVFDVISSIVKVFVSLLKGDFSGVKEGIVQIFTGIGKFLLGVVQLVVGLIVSLGIGALRAIIGIVTVLKDAFLALVGWVGNWAKSFAEAIWSNLPQWLRDLISGAIGFVGKVTGLFGGGDGGSTVGKADDFIWRAGQGLTHINPNDNVVGFKGAPPNLGGGTGYSPTYNINVSDMQELRRMFDEHDAAFMAQIQRNT